MKHFDASLKGLGFRRAADPVLLSFRVLRSRHCGGEESEESAFQVVQGT